VPRISEQPVSPDTLLSIKKHARTASQLLGIEPRSSTPSVIAAAVDEFVNQWQKGCRPDRSLLPPEDAALIVGSLWGEAIVSRFRWIWVMVTFHGQHNVIAPAIVSPDRSLAIYPLDHLHECFSDPGMDVNILHSYNSLKTAATEDHSAGEYCNLMDKLHQPKLTIRHLPCPK
jgi:hypothetical protein